MPILFYKHLTYQTPFTIHKSLATSRMSPSDLRAGPVSDFTQAETLLEHKEIIPALALPFSGEAGRGIWARQKF